MALVAEGVAGVRERLVNTSAAAAGVGTGPAFGRHAEGMGLRGVHCIL